MSLTCVHRSQSSSQRMVCDLINHSMRNRFAHRVSLEDRLEHSMAASRPDQAFDGGQRDGAMDTWPRNWMDTKLCPRHPRIFYGDFLSHRLSCPDCFWQCVPGEATPCKVGGKGQGT